MSQEYSLFLCWGNYLTFMCLSSMFMKRGCILKSLTADETDYGNAQVFSNVGKIQSEFKWLKVNNLHWYSLPLPCWLSHLGWASTGMVSLGTTRIGYVADLVDGPWGEELLDSMGDLGDWIKDGGIQWCFGTTIDGIAPWDSDAITSLSPADTDAMGKEPVMHTMGTIQGGSPIEVEVYTFGGRMTFPFGAVAGCTPLVKSK